MPKKRLTKREILIGLYIRAKGRCAYCGCKTKAPKSGKSDDRPNGATIEHVYTNYDLRRYAKGGNRTILACRQCNGEKGKRDIQALHVAYNMENPAPAPFNIIDLLKNSHLCLSI